MKRFGWLLGLLVVLLSMWGTTPTYAEGADHSYMDEMNVLYPGRMPSQGEVRVLVLYVIVEDQGEVLISQEQVENVFFNEKYKYDTLLETLSNQALYWKTSDYACSEQDSLTAFMSRASYGKLHITGDVIPYTVSTSNDISVETALEYAATKVNLDDYDSNGDGYIDGLYFAFATKDTLFDDGLSHVLNSEDGLKARQAAYIRAEHMGAGVISHETGHMLGFMDIYKNTNKNENGTGAITLMEYDSPIGDFPSIWKYLLRWGEDPIVIEQPGVYDVELESYGLTGEMVVVKLDKDNWFLMEYITDGNNDICEEENQMPGIRVWRIKMDLDEHDNLQEFWGDAFLYIDTLYMENSGIVNRNLTEGMSLTPYTAPSTGYVKSYYDDTVKRYIKDYGFSGLSVTVNQLGEAKADVTITLEAEPKSHQNHVEFHRMTEEKSVKCARDTETFIFATITADIELSVDQMVDVDLLDQTTESVYPVTLWLSKDRRLVEASISAGDYEKLQRNRTYVLRLNDAVSYYYGKPVDLDVEETKMSFSTLPQMGSLNKIDKMYEVLWNEGDTIIRNEGDGILSAVGYADLANTEAIMLQRNIYTGEVKTIPLFKSEKGEEQIYEGGPLIFDGNRIVWIEYRYFEKPEDEFGGETENSLYLFDTEGNLLDTYRKIEKGFLGFSWTKQSRYVQMNNECVYYVDWLGDHLQLKEDDVLTDLYKPDYNQVYWKSIPTNMTTVSERAMVVVDIDGVDWVDRKSGKNTRLLHYYDSERVQVIVDEYVYIVTLGYTSGKLQVFVYDLEGRFVYQRLLASDMPLEDASDLEVVIANQKMVISYRGKSEVESFMWGDYVFGSIGRWYYETRVILVYDLDGQLLAYYPAYKDYGNNQPQWLDEETIVLVTRERVELLPLSCKHSYGTLKTNNATCEAFGSRIRKCKLCGAAEVTILPIRKMPFVDVKLGGWQETAVLYMLDNGIMSGTSETTFNPNNAMTRAQLVTVLWNMEGQPKSTGTMPFSDVSAKSVYYKAILWGSQNKIINGYATSEFKPSEPLTRQQIAAILMNYSRYKGVALTNQINIDAYKDAASVSKSMTNAMQWAVGNKIISGKSSGTLLDPKGQATRVEVAAMVMNYRKKILSM